LLVKLTFNELPFPSHVFDHGRTNGFADITNHVVDWEIRALDKPWQDGRDVLFVLMRNSIIGTDWWTKVESRGRASSASAFRAPAGMQVRPGSSRFLENFSNTFQCVFIVQVNSATIIVPSVHFRSYSEKLPIGKSGFAREEGTRRLISQQNDVHLQGRRKINPFLQRSSR
jgi:hypothetical protein